MSAIHELLVEYSRMRENGLDAKSTLHALRPYIEPLPDHYKAQLAKNIRQWEVGELTLEEEDPISADEITQQDIPIIPDEPSEIPSPPKQADVIKPIKPIARQVPRAGEDLLPQGLKPGATWLACPNCGTKNKANEFFCYACGQMIATDQGMSNTRNFSTASFESFSSEYFSKDSILILRMRDSGAFFKLRPQNYTHELVIGRSTSNTAMAPDVDLAEEKADSFGVSRLHFAIQYMMEDSILTGFDLGSANGSYINGQKLHPSEKRVLRNGDEIRLGRLVIRADYEHPGPELG